VDNVVGSLGDVTGSLGNSGGTAVRISGGSILLDASTANYPFMDVNASSGSAVMRMGYLGGITSAKLGSLSGFGLWASGSAYFEGTVNATAGGFIGGWYIGPTFISSSAGNVSMDAGNSRFLIKDSNGKERVRMGLLNASEYGISGSDANGNLLFKLGEAGNEIAGWAITPGIISSSAGNVHIDATNSRFLIKDGSGQQRVRMGLLNASQYGISGSDANGNLLFKLGEAGNEIAGWAITPGVISSSAGNVHIDATNSRFLIKDGNGQQRVRMGLLNASQYGISGSDAGGNLLFKLGEAGNEIAGWGISPGIISSSTGNVQMDATNSRFLIEDGSGQQRVRMGLLNASQYGISGSDGDGNLLFKLGEAGNEIAGWEIAQGLLKYNSDSGSVALDATNRNISIHTGSINTAKPKVVMGSLPTTGDAKYGFAVFSGSANADIDNDDTYSVLITKDKARLAGWDLSPGRLRSGTVADINGNNASIALGTGATSATGTPTNGLFFVSASTQPVFYVGSTFSYVDDVLTAGGWKIAQGQISSSNGNAIISASGVLSLGTGTNRFGMANRTYIDGPNNQMSVGSNFKYSNDVLTVANWEISSKAISQSSSPDTDGIRIDSQYKHILIHGSDGMQSFGSGWVTPPRNNVRLALGQIGNGDYGIEGFDDNGFSIFELSDSDMRLAGMHFSYKAIWAGNAGATTYNDDGTCFLLDNLTHLNVPKLALGQDASQLSLTSGTGFFADGSGSFKAGRHQGSGIVFDNTADGELHISASEFFLGTTGQYISGSNGNIEISSSRFLAERDGDVFIGDQANRHARVNSAGFSMYDGSDLLGRFGGTVNYMGRDDRTHIKVQSYHTGYSGRSYIQWMGSDTTTVYGQWEPHSFYFIKASSAHVNISGSKDGHIQVAGTEDAGRNLGGGVYFKLGTFVGFSVTRKTAERFYIRGSGSFQHTGSLTVSETIRAGEDVIAYYSSDERLKNNIKPIKKPIYKLKKLKGVEYEWNGLQNTYASGSKDTGIIAQDVQKVLPQIVKERKDGYLGVRHDRLVGLLIEGIKEQQEQIDELKKDIEELKNGSP